MYFPLGRSLPERPEPDNTFWTASTMVRNSFSRKNEERVMRLFKLNRLE